MKIVSSRLRIGWLRAAVLGDNNEIISISSLIVGVAAAATNQNEIIVTGIAGLFAGAMSMAAGEYVSVSSQSDTEHADWLANTENSFITQTLNATNWLTYMSIAASRKSQHNMSPSNLWLKKF